VRVHGQESEKKFQKSVFIARSRRSVLKDLLKNSAGFMRMN